MTPGCGRRDNMGDICGETYTCPTCRQRQSIDQLENIIVEMYEVLSQMAPPEGIPHSLRLKLGDFIRRRQKL